MNTLSFISSIVRRTILEFRTIHQRNKSLVAIRKQNPTCVVKNCVLSDCSFGNYVSILDHAYLRNVSILDFSYISNNSTLINVQLGKFCSIGPYVQIGLAPHPTRLFVSTYPAFYSKSNSGCAYSFRDDFIFDDAVPRTIIGNDVWIGTNVIVPGGVSIGTGAIIAAGTVVTKDVPPYAVVGGNPSRIIRYRFAEPEIECLIRSEWWDWPAATIIRRLDLFSDIAKFVRFTKT